MKKKVLAKSLAALLSVGVLSFTPNFFSLSPACEAEAMQSYDLNFDSSRGVEKILNCEGRQIKFVAYENIVYVKNPASVERQILSIYIPAEYFSGGTINGYTAKTAPIFMPNGVGGYMPGDIQAPAEKSFMSNSPNASLVALSRGLVVVSPAIRGRTTTENNIYVGKAPALIVDIFVTIKINFLQVTRKKLFQTELQQAAHFPRRWEVWEMRPNLKNICRKSARLMSAMIFLRRVIIAR